MELTVQEIIAKVAFQKKQQKKVQQQNYMLQQINSLTMPNSNLMQKNPKLPSQAAQNTNPLATVPSKSKTKHSLIYEPFQPQTSNEIILQEKYKNLQAMYRKLKKKEESQIHIKQAYSQVQKKLQDTIKKNKKLQKELDSIRSKKSYLEQKSQQKNLKHKSIKQSQLFTPHTMSLQKNIIPKSIRKQPKLNFRKEKHYLLTVNEAKNQQSLIEEANFKGLQNEHKQIQQADESKECKDRINYQLETYAWCQREILHYKELIAEKKQSIMKFMTMAEKQDELIRKYEEISGTALKQKDCKQDKISSKTQKMGGKVSKIEGTIVKVKKLKENEDLKLTKEFTNRNTGFIKSRIMGQDRNEFSGVTNQKTEIKIGQGKKKIKQRVIEGQGWGSSYKRVEEDQNWVQSVAMNETSEFICEV